jgi:hypothetical protein
VLRKIFGRQQPREAAAPVEPDGTELAVSGYAHDCVIGGHLQLNGERLTDMLNDAMTVQFRDVVVLALDDGHVVEMPELEVGRDELLAVKVVGPRGNAGRRRPTREHGVALTLGPYRIWGYVHSLPNADPLSGLHGHRAMVPLTEVVLRYSRNGIPEREELAGLIVNRGMVDRINQPISNPDEEDLRLDATYGIPARNTAMPDALTALMPEVLQTVHGDHEPADPSTGRRIGG